MRIPESQSQESTPLEGRRRTSICGDSNTGFGARRVLVVLVILLSCGANRPTPVHAGMHLCPQTLSFAHRDVFSDSWQYSIAAAINSESPAWKNHGAGVWDAEHPAAVIRTAPVRPSAPAFPSRSIFGGMTCFVLHTTGGSMDGRSGSRGGGSSSSGISSSAIRLPDSLMQSPLHQLDFVSIPEAPPFEVFRPPPVAPPTLTC